MILIAGCGTSSGAGQSAAGLEEALAHFHIEPPPCEVQDATYRIFDNIEDVMFASFVVAEDCLAKLVSSLGVKGKVSLRGEVIQFYDDKNAREAGWKLGPNKTYDVYRAQLGDTQVQIYVDSSQSRCLVYLYTMEL